MPNFFPSTQYIAADAPAAVEPDGKVLVVGVVDDGIFKSSAQTGGAIGTFIEYDTAADSWTFISPPGGVSMDIGSGRVRMVVLPKGNQVTGQVLVSGYSSGDLWLYNPAGLPQTSWKPVVSNVGLLFNTFVLDGVQLNGLTTGADLGDDAKMATNFPVVSLVGTSGDIHFCRTYDFDQMAPIPNHTGSCKFSLPAGLPNGTYAVHVSANGIDSANSVSLTLPALDTGPAILETLAGMY
jgi:hypothetical protein